MKRIFSTILMAGIACTAISCMSEKQTSQSSARIPVIFDTDANNELDDQHALAYLMLNENIFDIKAITVNATYNGGDIDEHYKEASRILKLTNTENKAPLLKGANGNFESIKENTGSNTFDGSEAVNFIIESAKNTDQPLTLIAVGKLTNVALAFKKDPSIAENLRIVWLGSNYPEPGEYNQDNDTSSMNYLLKKEVPFEMVTVRYGKSSGTSAVSVTQEEINNRMPGLGPESSEAVTGRHGGSYTNFGDYSVNLFEHIDYGHGDHPSRALFDMAAVAIVKNPEWAESSTIPAPILIDNQWVEKPGNDRKIILWENFDKEKIIADFYSTLEEHTPAARKKKN